MFERLPDLVNGDTALVHRGRYLSVEMLLQSGDAPYRVVIRDGRIERVEVGAALMRPWRFAIRAEESAWRAFWQPVPRPGYHDIFAMCKLGVASVEGDLQPLLANLRYIKEVLAAPRGLAGEA
tara:strand:+ start:43 stop:411 length:369 start_codon:yes stop_codon:yes gene_type:complete